MESLLLCSNHVIFWAKLKRKIAHVTRGFYMKYSEKNVTLYLFQKLPQNIHLVVVFCTVSGRRSHSLGLRRCLSWLMLYGWPFHIVQNLLARALFLVATDINWFDFHGYIIIFDWGHGEVLAQKSFTFSHLVLLHTSPSTIWSCFETLEWDLSGSWFEYHGVHISCLLRNDCLDSHYSQSSRLWEIHLLELGHDFHQLPDMYSPQLNICGRLNIAGTSHLSFFSISD